MDCNVPLLPKCMNKEKKGYYIKYEIARKKERIVINYVVGRINFKRDYITIAFFLTCGLE